MRQFYKFLVTDSIRADDPAADLETPGLGRPLPKILSETEVAGLITAARAEAGGDRNGVDDRLGAEIVDHAPVGPRAHERLEHDREPCGGRCGEFRPTGKAPGTASEEKWLPNPL